MDLYQIGNNVTKLFSDSQGTPVAGVKGPSHYLVISDSTPIPPAKPAFFASFAPQKVSRRVSNTNSECPLFNYLQPCIN